MQITGGVTIQGGVNLVPAGSGPSASLQGSNFGYSTGGEGPGVPHSNRIDEFSFSSNGNATDVADLTVVTQDGCGASSKTFGYVTGGEPDMDNIQKFEFASDGDATYVGNLTRNTNTAAGAQY